jgi:histidinol phosphatase-like enzyme (inositol monophosphatase family)
VTDFRLPDITPEAIEATLREAADAAARETLRHFRTALSVDNKEEAGFDPVTEADRGAELAIRDVLARNFPGHAISGEEWERKDADSPYEWIIDPIDGTRAFISGIPLWGTLIGLTFEGEAVAGMMSQPFTGEAYFGLPGRAWLEHNGETRAIAVNRSAKLATAKMATTSPALFETEASRHGYQRLEAAARLARYGTDCYAYALLASGQIDLVVEEGLKAVDIAALIPIIENAGGIITSWSSGRAEQGGQVVAAANAELHAAALDILGDAAA